MPILPNFCAKKLSAILGGPKKLFSIFFHHQKVSLPHLESVSAIFIIASKGSSGVSCACPPGFAGNGIGPDGCTNDGPDPTECNIDCGNGICLVQNETPQCICYQGFSGDHCQNDENPCLGKMF